MKVLEFKKFNPDQDMEIAEDAIKNKPSIVIYYDSDGSVQYQALNGIKCQEIVYGCQIIINHICE